ncbi:amidase [Pseudomonas sp. NPDC089734]|uniref:amidase n=1 Tax=Pseudomonas sp. NPDC089734 TaxID=3364469 RepID=UPI003825B163
MNNRRLFIWRRPFTSLLLLVLFMMVVLAWQYRVALQAFPTIISAYTAKEYCSCRYVMNNPADYCHSYVKQYIPGTLADDTSSKTVSASGMGRSSRAAWMSERQGCRLLPDSP